jgi:hypothetical protein
MASKQSKDLNELKSTTELGECVVLCGGAKNYSSLDNAQATIHPLTTYFKQGISAAVTHKNFVVSSDCLAHDTVAAAFQ